MSAHPSLCECGHPGCVNASHCILDALWINPSEFENEEPILAAASLQEEFWKVRRAYKAQETAVVESLWLLVAAGGAKT